MSLSSKPKIADRSKLFDQYGRRHSYLRLSLTEKCNLRCVYCMPEEGVPLIPKPHLMTAAEVAKIAAAFVAMGVTKIRLTGGEPLVRKDIGEILHRLSLLPVTLAMTTNGILLHKYLPLLKEVGLKNVNFSLDSLQENRFKLLTRRSQFQRTIQNLELLIEEGFEVKVNAVLMKGVNEDEVADFICLTEKWPIDVRFIEFMPFNGNRWDRSKLVTEAEVLQLAAEAGLKFMRVEDQPNDTAHNYRLNNGMGNFGLISSITNPFCDSCNRLRVTADGKLKNCLFSSKETDLLTPFRKGEDIGSLVKEALWAKAAVRAGLDTDEKMHSPQAAAQNRSMTAIGG